ncbi:MAG: RNA ligase RtcB family protein, partial [Spirochaetes bacterium]|nr:RNA ligase RtcB family protein [Spirochaetota bacterium]
EDDFLNQFPDNDFKEKFGTIGSGNHFAEFQSVDKIICEENFSKNGLDKKFLYLLVHSGSRGYGNRIFDDCFNVPEFSKGFVYGSPSFDNYISGHNRALLWAELNRKAVAVKLLSLLNMNCDAERVLDLSHNYIEEKGSDDKKFFLHRKGAVSGEKGLIVIPGSRGSYSYLAEPVNSAAGSLYSVSHGAGRKWERSSCRRKLENKYTRDSIGSNKFGSRVICNDVNVLFEEAPEAYKNIDQVIADLVSAELIKVIAVLKPVLTYKDV